VGTQGRGPRPQDILLAALFLAMAAITPEHDPSEITLILLLGALQITESRFIQLDTQRGRVLWNVGKIVAGYLLIGYTGGIQSGYYLVLLFPVISAAATLGVFSTLAFTALACATYLSFLLPPFFDWSQYDIHQEAIAELSRRVLFIGIAGLLANGFALVLRERSRQLSETNRNLREAEAQVRRSERLAALGQLTAGLAHELRNPLGTIKGSADMLERNLPEGDPVARELAGFISSEVDRTNSLVSRFLDFARPLQLRLAVADLAELLRQAAGAAARDAEAQGVRIEVRTPPILFDFDAELLERVFVNLIVNAVQASAPGSKVTVESRVAGEDAVVEVADHGCGIEPDKLESIFNPFFTTKPSGTGLGLAIVSKIVSEHGGKIEVESISRGGSTFRVRLPRVGARE
jgi:signal transduction histidine kinase